MRKKKSGQTIPLGAQAPTSVSVLLGGYALSALGSGLVYPFTAIYLRTRLSLAVWETAAILASIAVLNICGGLVSGPLMVRITAKCALSVGAVIQAGGYLLLGLAGNFALAALAALTVGTGSGLASSALVPTLAGAVRESAQPSIFGRRYLLNNLGLGVGAVLGGFVLAGVGVRAFRLLYTFDALSYVIFAIAVASLSGQPTAARSQGNGKLGFRTALADPSVRSLLALQLVIVGLGYSQYESVIPLLMRTHLGLSSRFVGGQLALDTAIVVLLQGRVVRFTARYRRTTLISVLGAFWLVAATIGSISSLNRGVASICILAFVCFFALGETLYSPGVQPVLTRVAAGGQLAHLSALMSVVWGIGASAGPPVGVLLASSPAPWAIWIALAAGGLIIVLGGRRLAGRMAPLTDATSG